METRIWEEWNAIWRNPVSNVMIGLKNGNIRNWNVTITGPQNTPYYGGLFFIEIEFTNSYPNEPPVFRFKTKIYHPNISEDGEICLNILKKTYTPNTSIGTMISSLNYLLSEPNPHDPLRGNIAWQYFENRAQFEECAKKCTLEFAM